MKTISMRLVVVGIALLASATAEAATLYVNAGTGNDATTRAANSSTNPWRSIGRAAWGSTNRTSPNAAEAAQPGDTVVILTGTYSFSGTIGHRFTPVYNPVNQGTGPNSAITFVASGNVNLTAPSTASPVIGCAGRNYVVWQGPFILDEANISITPDTGTVVLTNATGCGVDGVNIDGDGAPTYVDNHTGVRIESCNSCFVRNSTIHDVRHPNGNHNGAGVMLYNSDNSLIENNHFYSSDNAVFIKGVFGVSSPQQGTIVRYNLMVNCDECITVQDSRDSRIYQNVIRDSQIGVNILAREAGTYYHPVGDWFFNNTIDNMASACIFAAGGAFHENVRVWNNIATNCGVGNYRSGGLFNSSGNVIDWEHNNYFNTGVFADDAGSGELTFSSWRSTYGHDQAAPAGINTNPMYANAGGDDFRLCTGAGAPHSNCTGVSPARNLGVDLYDLDRDSSTTDLIPAGAYVTNSEVIGPGAAASTPNTLSAPTNLRITGQ